MYRNRNYLPHIENPESTYFVTFRLAGTLPLSILNQIQDEIMRLTNTSNNRKLTIQEEQHLKYLKSFYIQEYLDKGIGECWLSNPQIAKMVSESIDYFDHKRYMNHVFCIMPNHFHWVLSPKCEEPKENKSDLAPIIHSIKSFTAHRANKILNRTGHFWSKEYYDHRVTSSEQFEKLVYYVLENPVKAGLCKTWDAWLYTKCSEKIRESLELL